MGEGKRGGPSARRGGGEISIENARREGGGGAGRVSAGNLGRGGNFFFFRAEIPTKLQCSPAKWGIALAGRLILYTPGAGRWRPFLTMGEAYPLTVGAFSLTVELLGLHCPLRC